MLADPKPARRVRDKPLVSRFLLANPYCEACAWPSAHAHHVLFRSQSGDDVVGNLIALCSVCHRGFHDRSDFYSQSVGLAVRRRVDVLDYLGGKLGPEAAGAFLERVYPL